MNTRVVAIIDPPDTYLATALSNSVAETVVLAHTIPAAFLGTFKSIGFKATFLIGTTPIVGPTLTIKVKLGSSVLTLASSSLAAGLANKAFRIEAAITNQSATNLQTAWGEMRQPSSGIFGALTPNVIEAATGGWSIDTTADQAAQITVQFGTANAANTIQMIQGTMTFG